MDEFKTIATLLRPLAASAPEALGLQDDAAVLPARPGYDLVVTTDAMVAGVHFLEGDPPHQVAQKLLRVNLSDLAAKGAEPYGYLLVTAWPPAWGEAARRAFTQGLAEDQARFGLKLFGGDTVSTPGPLTLSATLMGWVPAGAMVRRAGAAAGDVLLVSGVIGDGLLGLQVARGGLSHLPEEERRPLMMRFHLPEPRLNLAPALRAHAHAAADVSDGVLADAGHIGEASGLGVEVDLDRLPLSAGGRGWVAGEAHAVEALRALATAGDDYEIVCAAPPAAVDPLMAAAAAAGTRLTPIGRFIPGRGVIARYGGAPVALSKLGWTHDG